MLAVATPELVHVENRKAQLHMHPGQLRAWDSRKRFVCVLAGTQSGKTSFSPWWLWREIREQGPGDYLAVTATYDLFKLAMLPALLDTFVYKLGIGIYKPSDRTIEIPSLSSRIILRSAESDGGLESSTAKGAWLDEAGQDSYSISTWEAVLRRLSIHQGRVLLTTTLYNLGWLKQAIYDKWQAADRKHPDIDVIQFDSTENPAFPKEEFERARLSMPAWRFNMFYRGIYERPAGLIYDSFDERTHVINPFVLPDSWPRYIGLDFGGVHTAATFWAEEPATKRLYLYRTYMAGGRTAKEHAQAILEGVPHNEKGELSQMPTCVGGSKSEGQWRDEFQAGGLSVRAPSISDVEVGITRVYGAFKRDEIRIFDNLHGMFEELLSYSRKVDAMGEPTADIENKSTYHYLDSARYIIGWLRGSTSAGIFFSLLLALAVVNMLVTLAGITGKA